MREQDAGTRTLLQGFRNKGTFYKKYKLRTCLKNDVSLFLCGFFCYKTYLQIDSHLHLDHVPIKDRRGKLLQPSLSVQSFPRRRVMPVVRTIILPNEIPARVLNLHTTEANIYLDQPRNYTSAQRASKRTRPNVR